MVWVQEVDSDKTGSVWVDGGRFIILFPVGTNGSWGVRVGLKDSISENQEKVFKNRSKALMCVKQLLKSRSW